MGLQAMVKALISSPKKNKTTEPRAFNQSSRHSKAVDTHLKQSSQIAQRVNTSPQEKAQTVVQVQGESIVPSSAYPKSEENPEVTTCCDYPQEKAYSMIGCLSCRSLKWIIFLLFLWITLGTIRRKSNGNEVGAFGSPIHTSKDTPDFLVNKPGETCVDCMGETGEIPKYRFPSRGGSSAQVGLPSISPFFTDRKGPMDAIVNGLPGPKIQGQHVMVVSGLSGCGKTQLALKFIKEHMERFRLVIFIDASSPETIHAGFKLRLRDVDPLFESMTTKEILEKLAYPDRDTLANWLIVLDNADDPQLDLRDFIPKCDHGSILITTRNRLLHAFAPSNHLRLEEMTLDEAVDALLSSAFSSRRSIPGDREEAGKIVDALGRLPLAVITAGAYIEASHTFYEYRELLAANPPAVLDQPAEQLNKLQYPHGVHAAFDITLKGLTLRARELLSVLSFLHYTSFPRRVIEIAVSHDFKFDPDDLLDRPPQYQEAIALLQQILFPEGEWRKENLIDLLNELQRYSLVTLVEDSELTLRFHPLLLTWANSRIPAKQYSVFREASIRLLVCATDFVDAHLWEYLSPHVDLMWNTIDGIHVNDRVAISRIFRDNNKLEQYKHLWEGIYQDTMETHDDERNIRVNRAKAKLAAAHGYLGGVQKMEEMEREAVKLREDMFGRDSLLTTDAVEKLAHTVNFYNDEAAQLWNESLRMRRESVGPQHTLIADALYNLGQVLIFQARYNEAAHLLEEAVAMRTALHTRTNTKTVNTIEVLAYSYDQLSNSTAERHRREVLESRQKVHRSGHPNICYATHYLAISCLKQGQYTGAEKLFRDALICWRLRHKDTDVKILRTTTWLGQLLYNGQHYEQAEEQWREVLKGRSEFYRDKHPNNATEMHYLASVYTPVEVRWRDLLEYKTDPYPAGVLDLLCKLGWAAYRQRRYADANKLWKKLLEGDQKLSGDDYTDPAGAQIWLAETIEYLHPQRSLSLMAILAQYRDYYSSPKCPEPDAALQTV